MTIKFATLSMILDTRIEPNMDEHSGADELPFLSWKVGHKVKSNGSDPIIWRIEKIADAQGNAIESMTYFATVHLRDDDNSNESTNWKTLKGSTLQTSYSIVQQGEDDGANDAIVPTVSTKPLTIAVESIRNFYPRKGNKPGTRVILKSGVAYVVLEDHDAVLAKINA